LAEQLERAHLGVVEYARALRLQHNLLEARKDGRAPNIALTVEHPHVYTLGRRGKPADILLDEAELARRGVAWHNSDRGGEATYHGPGQLVAYPIIKLTDFGLGANSYVRLLERLVMDIAADFGIETHCIAGKPGVYTRRRSDGAVGKLAAIGVRISAGVAMHGFALNVTSDLDFFKHIVPCGSPGMQGASIQSESGERRAVSEIAQIAIDKLSAALKANSVKVEAATIFERFGA